MQPASATDQPAEARVLQRFKPVGCVEAVNEEESLAHRPRHAAGG